MTAAGDRRVAIACQGGGSHTAFTAGVLARLFDDGLGGHEVVGLSGTRAGRSARCWPGARCARATRRAPVRCWGSSGPTTRRRRCRSSGSTRRSRSPGSCSSSWRCPRSARTTTRSPRPARGSSGGCSSAASTSTRSSPSPRSRRCVIGAVDVLSGAFRAFDSRRDRITPDTILASAAIPTLFESVHIDDGVYWDGLFSQNPPIRELAALEPDEIWVIQINPSRRETVPRTTLEIADRRNELAGNLSLYSGAAVHRADRPDARGRAARPGRFLPADRRADHRAVTGSGVASVGRSLEGRPRPGADRRADRSWPPSRRTSS